MRPIRVVPVGAVDRALVQCAADALAHEFRAGVAIADRPLDAEFASHPERGQYFSTAIVDHLSRMNARNETVVGVTGLDLFIPILTFVFGEAQLGGSCAVVSYHRLTQEFYGLPPDPRLVRDRLGKEAVHEAGHTLGLTHCDDYECVMAAAHSVEWLDLKGPGMCAECRDKIGA